MPNPLNIPMGTVFGCFTVVGPAEKLGLRRRFLCRCVCGRERVIALADLRWNGTRSCRCLSQRRVIADPSDPHTEVWKLVVGYPDYEVSDLGNVRRRTPGRSTYPGRLLNLNRHATGYSTVILAPDRTRFRYVARLVVEAFIGPINPEMEVGHINSIRSDDRLTNLRVWTRQDLMDNAKAIGLIVRDPTARPRARRVYRERNPEKYASRKAFRQALRSGVLVPEPCEVCGDPKTQGHHDDYSRPLDVRWLCRAHHLEEHGGRYNPLPK